MNFLAQKRAKSFLSENVADRSVKSPFDNFYYREISRLTAAGGYNINFLKKESFLDPEARKILNIPEGYRASLKTALEFYAPESQEQAATIFYECSQGKEFSTTLKMLTYDKNEFWARAVGKPIYDNNNNVIGLQGIFQDINLEKLKELSLEKSIKVIESQNSRLFNFAHIVSHNLRSHASNLQLTLELLSQIDNKEEEEELKSSLKQISGSLNDTISHLNEIVAVQSKVHNDQSEVSFEDTLGRIKNSINQIVVNTNTEIYSDFSELPSIQYIPAYLESILLNLITNAIKYRHPDRSPVVDIYTYLEDKKKFLMIKDNGSGMDLERYGDKVFNMYKTFHHNEDAVGIGLFITKNQVEALQGTISVESIVGQGSTFKIKF